VVATKGRLHEAATMDIARQFVDPRWRRGFTIVETLIVITIIGILIAVLMPAIQASRAAAQRTQCRNNLRQLGLAATNHLDASGFFPSGGWGYLWAGDPDRGFGKNQPGGWIFSVLPYAEENAVWSAGKGINFTTNPAAKMSALAAQVNVPIAIFFCPTRRSPEIYPFTSNRQYANLNIADLAAGVIKTDYAINSGDTGDNKDSGPDTMQEADNGTYQWLPGPYTGVGYQRSEVTSPQVTDGLSHTYLIGEKYINPSNYTNGLDLGDNDAATEGFDNDMCRIGGIDNQPMPDTAGTVDTDIFGSAHPEGFNMVFCDGSVHMIDYSIDPKVHGEMANRADGQSVSSPSIH
jgi:prepilin-type N-terminal cleavage/methylation domain-containing protein/prepilin-type processing-associated H-X9-DG protein